VVEKWIHDMCHDQLIIVFFTTKMKKIQVLHKKIFLVSKDDNIKCFPQDACKYFPVQIVLFVDAVAVLLFLFCDGEMSPLDSTDGQTSITCIACSTGDAEMVVITDSASVTVAKLINII